MTKLHIFMEIDTCPICGSEVYAEDNGYLGVPLEEIPGDTVYEIPCIDAERKMPTCGKFVIRKRDPKTRDNDWIAEYIPVERDW